MAKFLEECKEWLEPLGYSLQFHSGDNTRFTFSNVEVEHSPNITCEIKNENKSVHLSDCKSFKLFLELKSSNLMFKHPDIEQFINVFRHYAMVCERFKPF